MQYTKILRIQIVILWTLLLWCQNVMACAAIDNDILAGIKSRIVLLGEIHGTVEMPEFASNLLCHYAQKKQAVVLGLEMPESMQPLLNAYMASGGALVDRNKLLAAPFWKSGGDFGMASAAILGAIENARLLKSKGYPVLLFAYDGATVENTVQISDAENGRFLRDFLMGTTIAKRTLQFRDSQFIILTGNLHAIKTQTELKMASVIEKFTPVFSAKFIPAKGGENWGCQGKSFETRVCGGHKMGPDNSVTASGYDTVIRLPEVHASAPALNADKEPDAKSIEVK